MKKVFGAIVVAFAFLITLVGCAFSTSAGSIKSGLQSKSFTISEYTPQEYETLQSGAIETTKFTGLQTIITASKKVNEQPIGIIILVFDSIDNAEKVNKNVDVLALLVKAGERIKEEGQQSYYGLHNNVIWAGAESARKAAGLGL